MSLLSFSCRLLEVKLTRTDKVNQFWGAVTPCDHNTTGTCRRKSCFLSQWLTASHTFLRCIWGALICLPLSLFLIYLLVWWSQEKAPVTPSFSSDKPVLANLKCIKHNHVWHRPESSYTAGLESVAYSCSFVGYFAKMLHAAQTAEVFPYSQAMRTVALRLLEVPRWLQATQRHQ